MQYVVLYVLALFFLVLNKFNQVTGASTAYISYSDWKFAHTKAEIEKDMLSKVSLFWKPLDPIIGTGSVAFLGENQEIVRRTVTGASVLPGGCLPRVYQGPPTDAKAIFSSCKYWSVDKNRNKAAGKVVPICECSGFVYDPSNLNVVLPADPEGTAMLYLEPGVCQAGVTCKGATADDAKSGCGPKLGTSGGGSGSPNNSPPGGGVIPNSPKIDAGLPKNDAGASTSSSGADAGSNNNDATGLRLAGVHPYAGLVSVIAMICLALDH